jgi:hypothetical protein
MSVEDGPWVRRLSYGLELISAQKTQEYWPAGGNFLTGGKGTRETQQIMKYLICWEAQNGLEKYCRATEPIVGKGGLDWILQYGHGVSQ